MFILRPYQWDVFRDHSTGILILHWSRQIGKTTTLAAWAVERILNHEGHTVTILSNSLRNSAEFIARAARFCECASLAPHPLQFKNSRYEIRLQSSAGPSRILALAANPRTARGFSGDLVLDEFAHCEDVAGIWDAAEPILASHPHFLCRIASTGNGRHNLFYRMTSDPRFGLSRVTRTDAWKMGVPILDPLTRKPITPEEARAAAVDKDSYDQNFECTFASEAHSLLSTELIEQARNPQAGVICSGTWSPEALALLERVSLQGQPLFAGVDVGRQKDRTVVSVVQSEGDLWHVRALLRLESMRLPDQQARLATLLRLPRLLSIAIDMTGLGLGLYEYTQQVFGTGKVRGINFSSSVPASRLVIARNPSQPQLSGAHPTVRVTESLAMNLVRIYEERKITHPLDALLLQDLQLPRRVVSPSGQVCISAERDESGLAGHADHFWSLALALDAARQAPHFSGHVQTLKKHRRGISL